MDSQGLAFRADTDDLDRFVHRGEGYAIALEQTLAELRQARLRAVAAVGPGVAPAAARDHDFEELVAEVGINNAFVAEVSRSLEQPGGLGRAGLLFDADSVSFDRPLAEDQELLRRLRARPLAEAGLSSQAIAQLVTGAEAHRAAIGLLDAGVDAELLSTVSPKRVVEVWAADLKDPAGEQLVALLTGSYSPLLEGAVMSGRVPPPDNSVRDAVVNAMLVGLSPAEANLPSVYFPTHYQRGLHERNTPRAAVEYFAAVAATSEVTAGSSWEGSLYGNHVNGIHHSSISSLNELKEQAGHSAELARFGARLESDPIAAVAFYNRLGVERAADLPSLIGISGLGRETFDAYGAALAGASQVTNGSYGSPGLVFSGFDLLIHPKRSTSNDVVWYSPALLFAAAEFDPDFLASATQGALEAAERHDYQGSSSAIAQVHDYSSPAARTVAYHTDGEDPRNILLARTAENPVAVTALLAALGGPSVSDGRAPAQGSLKALLSPSGSLSTCPWRARTPDLAGLGLGRP